VIKMIIIFIISCRNYSNLRLLDVCLYRRVTAVSTAFVTLPLWDTGASGFITCQELHFEYVKRPDFIFKSLCAVYLDVDA
jgi:hypothetical protein